MSKQSAIRWLKQALHDLQSAEKIISADVFDVAAFLAHQSVEKLLKGLLALRENTIPRTHSLDEILKPAYAQMLVGP